MSNTLVERVICKLASPATLLWFNSFDFVPITFRGLFSRSVYYHYLNKPHWVVLNVTKALTKTRRLRYSYEILCFFKTLPESVLQESEVLRKLYSDEESSITNGINQTIDTLLKKVFF